jgi:membrane associated rhomboid family serine protease
MFPLRSESYSGRFVGVTLAIIVACGGVFVMQMRGVVQAPGFVPLDFMHALFHPGAETLAAARSLLLSFFMHGSLFHLLSNIWYCWIFGSAVEEKAGSGRFALIYFLCGAISMIAQAASAPLSTIPVVGASGAIAGIMGLHLVFLPLSGIRIWMPPIFFFKIPAFIFLFIWFGVQYMSATASASVPIAWWAHIGGFIAGVALGVVARIGGRKRRGTRRPHRSSSLSHS